MQMLAVAFSFETFDWMEILYAVVGSFIGIFIPLWIDKIQSKKQEKEERRKLVSSLDKELQAIKELIELYSREDRRYQIFSFSTFVWDSVVAAGLLPQMLSDSQVHCEMLIEIYSELALLRDLHESFCRADDREELLGIYENIISTRSRVNSGISTYQSYEN